MSEIKQLPTRDEVPTPLTWDLTKIFKDDAAFDVAYNQLTEELNQAESFKGTLGNGAEAFLAALEYVLDVYRKVETLYVYSHLKNDQDTTNTAYQALYARASSLYAQVSEAVSWFDPEASWNAFIAASRRSMLTALSISARKSSSSVFDRPGYPRIGECFNEVKVTQHQVRLGSNTEATSAALHLL